MITLTDNGANALLVAIMRSPEFEPYERFFSLQVHDLKAVDTLSVSIVLTYDQGRFLSDLIGFNYHVLSVNDDLQERVVEKLTQSIRMLIGRALSSGKIPGGEEMRELNATLRAAAEAFDEG